MTPLWESFSPGEMSIVKWTQGLLGVNRTIAFSLGMTVALAVPVGLYWLSAAAAKYLAGDRAITISELFVRYAAQLGRTADYFARLREVVAGSPWPAVAVSGDYVHRLHEEMGIDPAGLVPIPPGIERPPAP